MKKLLIWIKKIWLGLLELFGFKSKPIFPKKKTFVVEYELPKWQKAPLGSNNHNVSESKIRRKMAAKSNHINRERVRDWKH